MGMWECGVLSPGPCPPLSMDILSGPGTEPNGSIQRISSKRIWGCAGALGKRSHG